MRSTQQFSITLPNEMAEAVRAKVAAGEYATESEVIRDGLRVLLARDRAVEDWLRKDVAAAYDKLKADPSRAVAVGAVKARLAAAHAKAIEEGAGQGLIPYGVVYAPEATDQLEELYRYIAERRSPSPSGCGRRVAPAVGSVVVILELVAHGEDGHRRSVFDLEQRHIAAATEGNEQFTQKRVVLGLAVDERRALQALHCASDRRQRPLGEVEVLGLRGAIEQVLVQPRQVVPGRLAVPDDEAHARAFFCSFVRA